MQKKLLAVAVAGALVAPAAAIAQSSVTIYGTISDSIETRSATGGDGQIQPGAGTLGGSSLRAGLSAAASGQGPTGVNASGTIFNASTAGSYVTGAAGAVGVADLGSRTTTQGAGSNFGIRVREDLGGSMYAWFQAELAVQSQGITPISASSGGTAPTYRNTGLALGSKAWGDIVFGVWDSPFNVNMNPAPQHAPYGNASTSFSAQFYGSSGLGVPATNSGQTISAMCNSGAVTVPSGTTAADQFVNAQTFTATAATCMAHGMSFHRRMTNSLQYWSPSWSGFQLKLIYSAEDLKGANNLAAGATTLTPRAWGGSLTYSAGPLYVGVGYERHNDFTAHAVRTFVGNGAMYIGGANNTLAYIPGTINTTTGVGISGSKDDAWNFNARYTFGAFTIGGYYERLKYTNSYEGVLAGGELQESRKRAYGLEGAFVTGPHTLGIRYAKARNVEGSTAAVGAAGGTFEGGGSGATGWIFGYAYSLSKRTSAFLYHTRITNDTNARYQGIVFNGLTPAPGADPRYTGVGLRHTF